MLKYWNFFLSEEEAADELEQPVSGLGQLTLKPCTLEQSRQWGADRWWRGGEHTGRQREVGDWNEKQQ